MRWFALRHLVVALVIAWLSWSSTVAVIRVDSPTDVSTTLLVDMVIDLGSCTGGAVEFL